MVMVMVMVVMTALALGKIYVAALLVAMLIPTLKLDRNVGDAVLLKLLAYFVLYLVAFPLANNVHRGIIARAVH